MSNSLSVFKNQESAAKYMAAYEDVLSHWPVPYSAVDIPTCLGQTHINVSGASTAPPLILLPGNFSGSITWFYNVASLSQACRVYAVDTPGDVGKSVPTRLPTDRFDYANWLNDLLAGLKIEQADLLGMSYGGFLAVNLALHFPERVHRLVLLCPGLPLAPFTLHWMVRGMPMLFSAARWAGEWFLEGASAKGYNREDRVQEAFVIGVMGLRSKGVLRPVIHAAEWQQFQSPTLMLVGEREILYHPRAALQRARQLMPHLETRLVPQAGHLLNCDQPERVGEAVLGFLGAKK